MKQTTHFSPSGKPKQVTATEPEEEEEYCILCKYKSVTPIPQLHHEDAPESTEDETKGQTDQDYIACDTCNQWVHMHYVNLRPGRMRWDPSVSVSTMRIEQYNSGFILLR